MTGISDIMGRIREAQSLIAHFAMSATLGDATSIRILAEARGELVDAGRELLAEFHEETPSYK